MAFIIMFLSVLLTWLLVYNRFLFDHYQLLFTYYVLTCYSYLRMVSLISVMLVHFRLQMYGQIGRPTTANSYLMAITFSR